MPNSAACFSALVVSPPALASATTLALEAWACSRNEEKSEELSGVTDVAQHLAAAFLDDVGGIAFQRHAEGVVGGDEEPGVLAAA